MRQELPPLIKHGAPADGENCHRQKLSSSSIPSLMLRVRTQDHPGNKVGHSHARLFARDGQRFRPPRRNKLRRSGADH